MIVTCPSCEAKYRVDAAALAARGNKVKCAACAHSWVVEDEGLTLNEPVEPSFDVSDDAPEPSAPEIAEEPAPSIREKPAAAVRARAEQQRRKQAMAVEGAGWAGVAACVAVALISAVIFRVNIVQTWPRTAGAYAAVGMDINPYGLEVGMLTASFEEGGLYVEGVVENITGGERQTLPLSARVLDAQGEILSSWPVQLDTAALPAGGAERFYTTLDTVPAGAVRVEVVIADESASASQAAEDHQGSDSHEEHVAEAQHAAGSDQASPSHDDGHGPSDHGEAHTDPHAIDRH